MMEKFKQEVAVKCVLVMKVRDLRSVPVATSAYLASIEPLVAPSWALVPLTLKLTPLGAFDLTSTLAINRVRCAAGTELSRIQTGGGMIEVLV